jgi:DNA-binding NtrC family response regulator
LMEALVLTYSLKPILQAHPRSILVVEDDTALSDYLASALGAAGYLVQVALDRPQALVLLARSVCPALVLLDLGLPPHPSTMAEGLAVLDAIGQQAPDAKTIVLTGQDEDHAALQAIRRGAFDFVIKPASLDALFSALRRAELFARQEKRLAQGGEVRLHQTARLVEGPKEAAAHAEEQLLRRSLAYTGYNVANTARQLGLAREHVYYYLKKYGVLRPA